MRPRACGDQPSIASQTATRALFDLEARVQVRSHKLLTLLTMRKHFLLYIALKDKSIACVLEHVLVETNLGARQRPRALPLPTCGSVFLIIQCFICKVSLLFSALHGKCPYYSFICKLSSYYLVLYLQVVGARQRPRTLPLPVCGAVLHRPPPTPMRQLHSLV